MVVDKIEHHNTDNGVYSNREYVFQNVEKDEDYLQKTVSNVKKNDARSEKNILLLAMSTLKKTLNVSRYTYEKKTLGSSHYVGQLEPLPKILAEVLAESNQRLDRIIVLNTRKTNEETDRVSGCSGDGTWLCHGIHRGSGSLQGGLCASDPGSRCVAAHGERHGSGRR